jgi:hypothetical protein
MTKEEIAKKMSSQTEKVPCLYCPLEVLRSDMPRVGVCKICYAKAIKEGTILKFKHLMTWDELFNKV